MKNALILSAGFGTRLSSLTETCPKPLLYLKGKAHIENILDSLISLGFEKIIINTHHLPQKFKELFPNSSYKNTPLIFSQEAEILDTGGAIKYILEQDIISQNDPLLVYNGDILFEDNLEAFIKSNDESKSANLVVLDDCANKNLGIRASKVVDLRFKTEADYDSLAGFAGIFIANKDFLTLCKNHPEKKFSSIDIFLNLLSQGKELNAHFANSTKWSDIGSYSDYINCQLQDRSLNKDYFDSLNIVAISIVEKGASDRKFFKLKTASKKLVACIYNSQKTENCIYAPLALWLSERGIPVPSIELFEPKNNLIIMQDCSDLDLLELSKNSSKEKIFKLYSKAFDSLRNLHNLKDSPSEICEAFSHSLYKWERDYFKENFIENFSKAKVLLDEDELSNLAEELLSTHPALVHRDCQSQNIMIEQDELYFIDFQGLRLGNKYYDLASLIFDSYTDFPISQREELFDISGYTDRNIFYKASCQRLMQALGAYAFLSMQKSKKEYTQYIPKALRLLKYCAKKANIKSLIAQLDSIKKLDPLR